MRGDASGTIVAEIYLDRARCPGKLLRNEGRIFRGEKRKRFKLLNYSSRQLEAIALRLEAIANQIGYSRTIGSRAG